MYLEVVQGVRTIVLYCCILRCLLDGKYSVGLCYWVCFLRSLAAYTGRCKHKPPLYSLLCLMPTARLSASEPFLFPCLLPLFQTFLNNADLSQWFIFSSFRMLGDVVRKPTAHKRRYQNKNPSLYVCTNTVQDPLCPITQGRYGDNVLPQPHVI